MKIVRFPVDVSRSHDARLLEELRTRHALVQATLDLVPAGHVEPTAATVATIAAVSKRGLFRHFSCLADLYIAAFDLAVDRASERCQPVDSGGPFAGRIERLVADRSALFEDWLPVWRFGAQALVRQTLAVPAAATRPRRVTQVKRHPTKKAAGNPPPSIAAEGDA